MPLAVIAFVMIMNLCFMFMTDSIITAISLLQSLVIAGALGYLIIVAEITSETNE